jgi:copper transport protein
MRKALAELFIAILLLSSAPAPLLAHVGLKSSSPAAGAHLAQVPKQLRLNFTETPELTFTSVRLLSASGREISLGPLAFPPDSRRAVIAPVTGAIEAGIYVVTWQVAGDDGHPVRGRFEFVVAPGAMGTSAAPGEMSGMHHDPVAMPNGGEFGAESALYVVIRWAQFTALLLIIGAVSFRYFVLGYLRRDTEAVAQPAEPAFLADAERDAAGMGYLAVGILAATLILRLLAQSYAMHGAGSVFDVSLVGAMVRKTMWGWGWLLQVVGILLAGVGFHRARSSSREVSLPGGEAAPAAAVWWRLATCGAVASAFSPAFSGHAASAPTLRALAIVTDGLHVLSASSWLGALTVVLIAGLTAAMRQAPSTRGPLVRSLINAFSPVALASAGLAAATGVFAAWLHVGTIPNIWGTRYGIILLIKLAILGIVALTGFYNWRFVQPRLGTDEATTRLRRSARVEVAVAVIVLLVTAILVATPTAMDASM